MVVAVPPFEAQEAEHAASGQAFTAFKSKLPESGSSAGVVSCLTGSFT